MEMIVTPNNRDSKNQRRWLIREASQQPDEAVEHRAVLATDVVFFPSDNEAGLGASITAHCESAIGFNTPMASFPREVRLRFSGKSVFTEDGEQVKVCLTLRLQPDGSMFALLPPKKDAPARTAYADPARAAA